MQQDDEAQRLFVEMAKQLRELNEKISGIVLSPTVFSYEEARKRLMEMSESTLRRMIRSGHILRSKVGRSYGISIQEIERVAATLVGPNGEPVEEKTRPAPNARQTPRPPKQREAKNDADKIRAALRKKH